MRLPHPPDGTEGLADAVFQAMAEGVILADGSGRVLALNPAAQEMTGWNAVEAQGTPIQQVFRPERVPGNRAAHPLDEALLRRTEGRSAEPFTLARRGGGVRISVQWRARPFGDRLLLLFQNVTETSLLAQELEYRTRHDLLTGLLNREEFEQRLLGALADFRRTGRPYLLGVLDLDQFRMVNDTAGHSAGDEMLREVAALLRGRLGEDDVVARLGGDEFGLLVPADDADRSRQQLESVLEGLRRHRFEWDSRAYTLTGSLGIATLSADVDSVARLMSDADAACKAAKDGGRDRLRYADRDVAQRYGELTLMGRFAEALKQNRFVLFAEDVVAVQPPHAVAYRELLVRWRDEHGRLIYPSSFIQVAERYFLITALDRWVVEHAFESLARRPDEDVVTAVNLSGQSLADEQFLEFVLQQLERTGLAPGRVCFEITETAAISRLSEASRFIHRLSEAGVRFALDDFGTGMASFSYLKNLKVDYLKIDGSFVQSMLESRVDRGMVEAIHRIGHQMGLQTIAENVESRALLPVLAGIGVDFAQGRAISQGRPFDEL